jgi:hypothetical protein
MITTRRVEYRIVATIEEKVGNHSHKMSPFIVLARVMIDKKGNTRIPPDTTVLHCTRKVLENRVNAHAQDTKSTAM